MLRQLLGVIGGALAFEDDRVPQDPHNEVPYTAV
jgi:hypothetical protein